MSDQSVLRVANAHGYWGDLPQAAQRQVMAGDIDVLTLEYLAEVTMGILARQMQRDSGKGYVSDVVEHLEPVLTTCYEKDIPVVTSAGGLNPEGCGHEISSIQHGLGLEGHIAVLLGDDCRDRLAAWRARDVVSASDRQFLRQHQDQIVAANRYFGSRGIAKALNQEAQVVVTGRVTDTSLVLGPAMNHFGWAADDYDQLAAGIVAGHLLECGGQATGGNYSGDWTEIPDLWNLGYPIAELTEDGSLFITKHEDLGGRVSVETVSEQLLYELEDPSAYLTPDVTVDFTDVEIRPAGEDRVEVTGFTGSPPPTTDKVSLVYEDGYQIRGQLVYSGPDALTKSQVAQEILRKRCAEVDAVPERLSFSHPGRDSCHGELANPPGDPDEIVLRLAAVDQDRGVLDQVGRQFMALILSGPPGCTGFGSGRPTPRPILRTHSLTVPRNQDDFRLSWP